MKLLAKKRLKVWHEAGEIVEIVDVSSAEARFLIATGQAEPVAETAEPAPKPQKKATRKKKN